MGQAPESRLVNQYNTHSLTEWIPGASKIILHGFMNCPSADDVDRYESNRVLLIRAVQVKLAAPVGGNVDQDIDGIIRRSKTLIDQERFDDSLEMLLEALNTAPEYSDIHNQLGIVYCMKGSYGQAVDSFKRALELNPDYIEAYLNLSITYSEMGKYTSIISEYRKAVELESIEGLLTEGMRGKIANAHKDLGILYLEIEETGNAIHEFDKALSIAPDYLDIRTLLANAYIRQEEYDSAIAELDKVIEINPAFSEARLKLAVAYIKKGEKDKAAEILRAALSIDPDNEKVKAFLELNERDRT